MSLAFLSISFEIFDEQFNFLFNYNGLIQVLFIFSLTIVYFSFFYWIYNLAKYLITDFKKVVKVVVTAIILFFLILIIEQIENYFPHYIYMLNLFQFSLIILFMYSLVFIIPYFLNLIFGDPIKTHFRGAQLTLDKLLKENSFLFSWNNVPGKDNKKLLEYFNGDLGINWVECAEICKSGDDKTIRIFKDEKSIEIIINKNEMKAILIISDNRTYDLEIKKENGKLNIHKYSKNRNCISQEPKGYISLIDIFFITENYTAGIKKIKQSFGKEIQFDKIINSNTKQSLNEMLDQLTFSIPYYILYGGIEQMRAMNTHLENLNKYIGDNYSINGSQFITEIIRMNLEIEKFLKVNSFEFLKIEKPRDDKYIYIKKQIILGSVTLIYSIILIKLV
ncbi:MAG: hypothetical protein KAJ93_06500 [Methanosarcinales archaeon]|nr:hypothetical protein [Methanosarcinales archaeon]